MIHYHGTPSGGKREEVVRWLRGRHALVPFFYQEDMPAVADVCASFILDNSAYTVDNSGGELDIPGFIRWVELWCRHPGFDWALIPDVIGGDDADNDALLREWPAHLRGKGVPVWHLHESLERLARLVREYHTVALGSSGEWPTPGAACWWVRMAEVMSVACDEAGRPFAHMHGLRMLNTEIFTRLPLKSADSVNAAMNSGSLSRFGMYTPPTSGQRATVIADRIEAHNSAPLWVPPAFQAGFL